MGEGIITQMGRWIAYPFKEEIPLFDLVAAVLIIAVVVWFLADATAWPEISAA